MTTRRILTILVSAALTASLATVASASDTDAAKEKRVVRCDGKVATMVGTAKADVILGTFQRDIIAGLGGNDIILGRGGNDIICGGAGNDRLVGGAGHDKALGQAGRDRLFGGAGVDRLFGGLHNDVLAGQSGPDVLGGGAGADRLDGGTGVDLCSQGSGHGPVVRCELPKAPVVVPPTPKTLAIAYSDLVRDHQYGSGDVLIAKLVDTNLDGVPSKGDTIEMDRYPVDVKASAFAFWGVDRHTVASVDKAEAERLHVITTSNGTHTWHDRDADEQSYTEWLTGDSGATYFYDWFDGTGKDELQTWATSPSHPGDHGGNGPDTGDNRFIDVELDYPAP